MVQSDGVTAKVAAIMSHLNDSYPRVIARSKYLTAIKSFN